MYESWYDYVKPKYGEKANLYYMDIDSFIVYEKIKDINIDISKDVETRSDASNCKLDRLLEKGKKTNWINERRIRWENNKKVCSIECKNI